MDTQAGVTPEEGSTGFLHLPSAVLAINFYRDKDSAFPFPRRLSRRILWTNDWACSSKLIVA